MVTAALAYGTGIAAARRLGSRLASFVALSEVLVALVAAWLLLGEVPRRIQVAGGVLILAGVVVGQARRAARRRTQRLSAASRSRSSVEGTQQTATARTPSIKIGAGTPGRANSHE